MGSHPSVKYEYKRKEKICVIGALNSEYFIYAFTDWLNDDVFKTFLQRLIYQFGKLVIVIDQGPYHTSDMQKFYEKNKEHLHVVYFPSYSPELDSIEQSWRAAKKWLSIRYWENKRIKLGGKGTVKSSLAKRIGLFSRRQPVTIC